MRKILLCSAAAIMILAGFAGTSKADLSVGLSIGDGGIKGFYLAIGEHYKVAEKDVIVLKKQKVPDEELPVVFYLSNRAYVTPAAIIKLRLSGKSWMDITFHYGLTAEVFYVPVKEVSGPPYGKAYGHFKNKKKTEWRKIRFSDAEIVNFVNLKFISEHYDYSPDEVIKMRSGGKGFVAINGEIKSKKDKVKFKKFAHGNSKTAIKQKVKGKKK